MNEYQVKPGDVIQYSNAHKKAPSLLEYSHTIVRCCPKKVFYRIRNHTKIHCLYWEEFNRTFKDMAGRVLADGEKPSHIPPDFEDTDEFRPVDLTTYKPLRRWSPYRTTSGDVKKAICINGMPYALRVDID